MHLALKFQRELTGSHSTEGTGLGLGNEQRVQTQGRARREDGENGQALLSSLAKNFPKGYKSRAEGMTGV